MTRALTDIQRKKHEAAVLARIGRLQLQKQTAKTTTTLGLYQHLILCGYLNDDGVQHVESIVGIIERDERGDYA